MYTPSYEATQPDLDLGFVQGGGGWGMPQTLLLSPDF